VCLTTAGDPCTRGGSLANERRLAGSSLGEMARSRGLLLSVEVLLLREVLLSEEVFSVEKLLSVEGLISVEVLLSLERCYAQ